MRMWESTIFLVYTVILALNKTVLVTDLDIMIVTTMQHHLYGSVHRSYILADSVDQLGW